MSDVGLQYVEAATAWRDFARHQEWCRYCAESVAECSDGTELKRRAEEIDAAMDAEAAEILRTEPSARVEQPAVVIEWDVRKPLPEKQIVELLSRFAHHMPPTFKQWERGQAGDVEYPIIEITVRTRSGQRSPDQTEKA